MGERQQCVPPEGDPTASPSIVSLWLEGQSSCGISSRDGVFPSQLGSWSLDVNCGEPSRVAAQQADGLIPRNFDWTSLANRALWWGMTTTTSNALTPALATMIGLIDQRLKAAAARSSAAQAAIAAGSSAVAIENLLEIEQGLFEAERLVHVACLLHRERDALMPP